ncbi:hypothetical protein FAF44_50110 [Nonomuraea sp. MG754425]|uniref:hypothetical protein n=1 Tax=Nonomuraea sp. MG754425 TaxID=2570319 RepID=UPI001F2243CD|nr:hypothetical protein [Nonomuraea sp. MG754425]MCF6476444.1 hypothetical protein [Nonomuraea sp. MG754425]
MASVGQQGDTDDRRSRAGFVVSGYTTVPYTIAYANELVEDPISFEWHNRENRLTYGKPRRGDWMHGVLLGRVRDLRDRPDRRGPERMRKLNRQRQRRCMDKLLCQVCGAPATDPDSGLIPWVLTKTVFERTGPDSGRTNAPPTCWTCMPEALEQCPMLNDDFALYTVASTTSAGVLADLYRLGVPTPTLSRRNVFVAWDAIAFHARALATSHVVELHGMRAVNALDWGSLAAA